MSDKAKIRESIRRLTEKNEDAYSVVCRVDSIDLTEGTCYCIPVNGDPDIQGVRLQAKKQTGFLIKPTIDSEVVVSFLSDSSAFISQYSTFTEMQLNGDANGGIAKTAVVRTKLNTLEAQENALKVIVAAIIAAGASSPSTPVTNGTLAAYFTTFNVTAIVPTTQAEISSTTVKHGNG
jgi:hypothetical protein